MRTRVARVLGGRDTLAGTKDGAAALEPVGTTSGPWLLQLRTMQEAQPINGERKNGHRVPTRTLPVLKPVGQCTWLLQLTGGACLLQLRTVQVAQPINGKGQNGMKLPTRTRAELEPVGTSGTTGRPWLVQLRKLQVPQPNNGFGQIGTRVVTCTRTSIIPSPNLI